MFKKAKEISDDKVNIAVHTYEMVDKHIRKLDSDLAKFEAEMKVKVLSISVHLSHWSQLFSTLSFSYTAQMIANTRIQHFGFKTNFSILHFLKNNYVFENGSNSLSLLIYTLIVLLSS